LGLQAVPLFCDVCGVSLGRQKFGRPTKTRQQTSHFDPARFRRRCGLLARHVGQSHQSHPSMRRRSSKPIPILILLTTITKLCVTCNFVAQLGDHAMRSPTSDRHRTQLNGHIPRIAGGCVRIPHDAPHQLPCRGDTTYSTRHTNNCRRMRISVSQSPTFTAPF